MFYFTDLFTGKAKGSSITISNIPVNGMRIVKIPSQVSIDETDINVSPNLTYLDLIRQKHEGLLASEPSFNFITYDDMIDSTWVNAAAQGFRASYGETTFWLPP